MRILTPEGEEAKADFEDRYGDRSCTCFISPPCGYCTHYGHPLSVEETEEFWTWVPDGKSAAWQPWHAAPWFATWLDLCYRPFTHRNDHLKN